jgi:photosystem II stability/assembly factor-like uncharacterized protein
MSDATTWKRKIFRAPLPFAFLPFAALAIVTAQPARAQTWRAMGPPGGDVRSLAEDPSNPQRLFLGTTDGHVFRSEDAGEHWEIAGRAGPRQDAVLAALVVDPRGKHIVFAATWTLDPRAGGGVFRSEDDGRTWRAAGLAGKAVRALALAPSQPDVLVAGTLDGVYRSEAAGDAERKWERISPEGDEELRNLDSVAIDPRSPGTIYAGTYHLPWKTVDGGRHWLPIHEGMIDDSDVMSIFIDGANPRRLYASACSGIYRSDNAGALWRKIQGIPYTARRTLVIRQEARHPQVVYAGTTEGLWKTVNAGASWQRVTPANWEINSLAIDEQKPGVLVIGTGQLGVLRSDDAGKTFRPANDGFNHRQIISLALDPARPSRILAVLTNAPEPVLATDDGGRTWLPLGPGLRTEGLKRVYASPDGWWAALERGGLMRYDAQKGAWIRAGVFTGEIPEAAFVHAAPGAKPKKIRKSAGPQPLAQIVNDMAFAENSWFAATGDTLLVSHDRGATWTPLPLGPVNLPTSSVRASLDGMKLWVVSLRGMVFSLDGGKTWAWRDLPREAGGALRLDTVDEKTFLATATRALYLSRDGGHTWQKAGRGIPDAPLQGLAIIGNIFLASMESGGLFISRDLGATWDRIEGTLAEGFFPVVTTTTSAETLYAASSTDSVYAVDLRAPKPAVAASLSGPR